MGQRVGRALFIGAIAVWIFFTWLVGGSGSAAVGSDDATITRYDAVFDVRSDGQLVATEDLAVDFPTSRHGIFRFFDVRDASDPHARLVPTDVTVTRDGRAEPFTMQRESHGRYRVAKIGDPNVLVGAGVHRYRISYRIDGALEHGTTTPTRFYWNLVPGGWRMAIDRTRLTVHLPAPAQGVRCAVGAGSTGGCVARGGGSDTLRVQTGPLPPNTPVTVQAGLDIPTPPRVTVPWDQRYDPWLGTSPVLLGLVLAAAVAAGVGGVVASARTREPRPGYPLQYAPPEGIGPAQAVFVLEERIEDKSFVATLMHAAEQGAVALSRDGEGWTVQGRGGSWQHLDDVTRQSLQRLLGAHTDSFTVSQHDVLAGQQLQSAVAAYKEDTRRWASKEGYVVRAGLGSVGGVVALVALGAGIALSVWNPFDMAVLGLVPGLFGLGALALVRHGSGTRRTARGRELWARIGGFRRILSTRSSEARFDFSARKDLYTAYLPWAVAFGVADAWARKYRTETGAEPPAPAYFVGYTGDHTGAFVDSMVSDFQSTMHSAISSYQSTLSSSSSGGGGFSGGGGGGGGGGGSW